MSHSLNRSLVRIGEPASLTLFLKLAPFLPAFVAQQLVVGQEPRVRGKHGVKEMTGKAFAEGAHFHALFPGADPDCAIGVTAAGDAGSTGSCFVQAGQEIPEWFAVRHEMDEIFKTCVFHFPVQDFRCGVDPNLDGAISTIQATVADEFLVHGTLFERQFAQ